MRSNKEEAGITLDEAPIKNPGSIGVVELYHAPLRCADEHLRKSLDKSEIIGAECLQMEVYSNNATIGP